MNRLTFKDTDGSNIYQLPYNPQKIDMFDSAYIHGNDSTGMEAKIYQTNTVDARIRKMFWSGYTSDHVNFVTMMNTLKLYENTDKLLHLGDADYNNFGWIPVRILNVRRKIIGNRGLKYSLEIDFVITGVSGISSIGQNVYADSESVFI